MVLSIKSAAVANYYFQDWGGDEPPETSGGVWLSRPLGLGFSLPVRAGLKAAAVAVDDLERLLHRKQLTSGEMPTFNRKAKSSGHDFVFSVPKSVSVLWALRPGWRKCIERAQEEAVKRTVSVLLDHAIKERVGKGGRKLANAEAAVATFFHYKCRPARHPLLEGDDGGGDLFPDPNLHTHVVVPDVVIGSTDPTKRRLKVVYTALYGRWAMALGAWYHAHLAYELRLCGLTPKSRGTNGLFELDIFEPSVVPAFSARTEGARHLFRVADRAGGLAATRTSASNVARAEHEQAWCRLRTKLAQKNGRIFTNDVAPAPTPRPKEEVNDAPVAPGSLLKSVIDDLTTHDAVLQLPDLYRGLAGRIVADGLRLRPSVDLVNALIARKDLIALAPSESYGFERWTSKANLEEESEVVRIAFRLKDYFFPRVPLAQEQRRAFPWTARQWQAAQALTNMERLIVLTGPPGAGKTKILEPVVAAYKGSGKRVVVAAEAWQTALEAGRKCAAHETYALAMLFEKARRGRLKIDKGSVLIVDEAGLLSTRRMLQLLRLAESSKCKLILLGDVAQLSPIGAGSGMTLLKKVIVPFELNEICRQESDEQIKIANALVSVAACGDRANPESDPAYERMAVEDLAKAVSDADAWESYANSKDAVDRVARETVEALSEDEAMKVVALARSHREAQHISRVARRLRRDRKEISEREYALRAVTPMGTTYRLCLSEGDRIRFLTKAPHLHVVNGTRAVITRIEVDDNKDLKTIHARLLGGDESRGLLPDLSFTPRDFHDEESRVRIACDYAATIFGSQGATYDEVVVLRSRHMTFRELYVALTRASRRARVVEVDANRAWHRKEAVANEQAGPANAEFLASMTRELIGAKRRDASKSLAIDARSPKRHNRPERRAEWLWDALVLEKQLDGLSESLRSLASERGFEASGAM